MNPNRMTEEEQLEDLRRTAEAMMPRIREIQREVDEIFARFKREEKARDAQ